MVLHGEHEGNREAKRDAGRLAILGSKSLRPWTFWVWIFAGAALWIVAPIIIQERSCKGAPIEWPEQGDTHPRTDQYRRHYFRYHPIADQQQNSSEGNDNSTSGEDPKWWPQKFLCADLKITDLALAFFTYALAVVGWFTMRSGQKNTINVERAYVFLSHGEPRINADMQVSVPVQAVNQGRLFGILKRVDYGFTVTLPPHAGDTSWGFTEHDWSIAPGERKQLFFAHSHLRGSQFFVGRLVYEDAFTGQRHESWTTIEFNPAEGQPRGKRGGGDAWNVWD